MNIFNELAQSFNLIKSKKYMSSHISDKSKKLICEYGLPDTPLDFINFNLENRSDYMVDEEYTIIGDDYGTLICINNKSDEIFSIDQESEYPN